MTGHDGRLTARKNCLGNWQYHERLRVTSCIVPLAWRNIIEHFQFSHLDNQTNFPIQFSGGARKSLSHGSDNWIECRRGYHWYEISERAKLHARWSSFVTASRCKCKYLGDFMQKLCRKFREQIFSIIVHLISHENIVFLWWSVTMDLFDYIIWRIDTFSIIEFLFNISSVSLHCPNICTSFQLIKLSLWLTIKWIMIWFLNLWLCFSFINWSNLKWEFSYVSLDSSFHNILLLQDIILIINWRRL